MINPSEVFNVVNVPAGSFIHTAVAGNVLAVADMANGRKACLMNVQGNAASFQWFEFIDGSNVQGTERARADIAMDPGYLFQRLV